MTGEQNAACVSQQALACPRPTSPFSCRPAQDRERCRRTPGISCPAHRGEGREQRG